MRTAELGLAAALLIAAGAAQAAPPRTRFRIDAPSLSAALIALGEQAQVTIAATDPGLQRIRARRIDGRLSLAEALRRLLAGTGYTFELVAPGAVRIVALPPPPRAHRAHPLAAAAPPEAPPVEIVVTASKQSTLLSAFPGTAHVVDLTPGQAGRSGGRGTDSLLERLPMLAATNLGASRNKLFIRGIADSSFNGPSQSVSGQYLGDVRLTFNAPDPDLRLYDVSRVELLEGPEGTLYGSGALGGILRIVPNPPDLDRIGGAIVGGAAITAHGQPGGDVAAMLNLPVSPGTVGLRLVGYDVVDGGYIDDLERGLRNVNRTVIEGGRASLLVRPARSDWQIELGAIVQDVAGRDGQYAERGLPALSRRSALAQPFDNDYFAGSLTARRDWAGLEFVSTTELVKHAIDSQFDATGFPGTSGPIAFREDSSITMIANETRIARKGRNGAGWLAGFSFVHDVDQIDRNLGPPDAVVPRAGVRNAIDEAALFGQYGLALLPDLVATAGGRLTYSDSRGNPLNSNRRVDEPTRQDFRLSPAFSLSWQPARRLLVYARYQQGFRAGGIALGPSRALARRFASDALDSTELGLRFGRPQDRFSFDAAVSHASWTNMQADLIDARGLPFTANIGDGRINGLEATASWRPLPGLRLDAAAFLDDSALTQPNLRLARGDLANLPNIAEAGARAGGHYETRLSPALTLEMDAVVRYVGKSQLGVGPPLDISQGDYVDGNVGGQLDFGRYAVSLDIGNVADARGNSFAYGNPFQVADRRQVTPLRPRTVRLGLSTRF